ncbi:ROK family protein [Nocardioides sp. TF02-7]|nr:ROK family protein [Nocardioides sp. TF02-7]UMG92065.1 ROK family protein [Nocardioides sp. TF02-7]
MHVGVDVGGTKVLAVRLADQPAADGQVVVAASAQVPMPGRDAPDAAVEAAVAKAVHEATDGRTPTAVGLSSAGLVDRDGERVRFAAHLPWRDAPVRSRVEELVGAPVSLDNDANCAALAEVTAGAARGASSAVLVTVGTGIGGALVIDGRVVRGANGMAGEFGHMQVVPDGLPCECGLRGCWEQYASGRALERVMRVSLGSHLDGPEVAASARGGDPLARQAFASVGTWLGVGVAGLVSAFDPAVVVIGGGVSAVGDLLLEPARRCLLDALQGAEHRQVPPLVPTRFGPEASAVGAALLARDGRG